MNNYPFHQSLLDTTTTTTTTATTTTSWPPKSVNPNTLPTFSDLISRLILISSFATVAIWANHEASKGFSITILNDAGKHSMPGRRFSLFYESNDKATRIVLNTSSFVENLLYPNQDFDHRKKQINSVTLKLAPKAFPAIVSVYSRKPFEYMIMLSPSLMETSNHNDSFVLAVLQGIARVWLWDGKGVTPPALLNGMVEYISALAGFQDTKVLNFGGGATMLPVKDEICWKDEDPRKVARFLRYYDQRKQGSVGGGGGVVIRRLNDVMRDVWHDGMMDDALGMAGQHACASYDIFTRHHHLSSSI
ncbi:hypothetical protein L1987_03605 [Smallanthus sonchifolius]|uniref:Uncharacterized protein n=1 Tax=Smallanthus sonchifolius TaxID=185202 RepID=A0ACB9KB98_9ASTR|nr:hypothetical protein L1987_03605 [Smallanthus sonchifolius]